MKDLVITLTGEVVETNFDNWKKELQAQIESTQKPLKSDNDFASAAKHVKQLKTAEKSLKKAKLSAINQAADIQALFAAIDEVAEQARQARLGLEKQIKTRKQDVKNSVIEAGIAQIQKHIESKSSPFDLIDHSEYLDRAQFVAELKGRSTLSTLEKAKDKLCTQIMEAVDERDVSVSNNSGVLDSLPDGIQALFQDRAALIALPSDQLNKVVDERQAVIKKEGGGKADAPDAKTDDIEIDFDMEDISDEDEATEEFELIMQLNTSEKRAERLKKALVEQFENDTAVATIILNKKK